MADNGWAIHVAQRDGGHDHQALLALHPSLFGSVHASSHRLGDEGTRTFAARSRRSSGGLRRRRPALHLGQPLPRARAAPLAVRASFDTCDLRGQVAHGRRVVHSNGNAWLVTGDLPTQGRQLAAHLLTRLSARSFARLGASSPLDETRKWPTCTLAGA